MSGLRERELKGKNKGTADIWVTPATAGRNDKWIQQKCFISTSIVKSNYWLKLEVLPWSWPWINKNMFEFQQMSLNFTYLSLPWKGKEDPASPFIHYTDGHTWGTQTHSRNDLWDQRSEKQIRIPTFPSWLWKLHTWVLHANLARPRQFVGAVSPCSLHMCDTHTVIWQHIVRAYAGPGTARGIEINTKMHKMLLLPSRSSFANTHQHVGSCNSGATSSGSRSA